MDILDLLMVLRLQICCVCVTLFVAVPFFAKKRAVSYVSKLFRYVLIAQIISLVFDMVTVYTVNNIDTVPALINKICHIVFIIALCCFVYLTFLYVRSLVTDDRSLIRILAYGIPVLISVVVLIAAPLHYMETAHGNYSEGPGATAVYCIVGIYLLMMLYIMLRYRKRIRGEKRQILVVALLTEILVSVLQLFIPALLISSLGTTLITLAIYLMIENPDRILKNLYQEENLYLQDKMRYDALTGIYNRRYMEEQMASVISTERRSGGGKLSVLMMDIDFFKLYNDTYGHTEGDNCLHDVAKAIAESVERADDFAARYGGEEFVIVLPNTDEDGARVIAERVLENVRKRNIIHEKNEAAPYVTLSIGVFAGDVTQLHEGVEFIKRADEALYVSKENGRNQVNCYREG